MVWIQPFGDSLKMGASLFWLVLTGNQQDNTTVLGVPQYFFVLLSVVSVVAFGSRFPPCWLVFFFFSVALFGALLHTAEVCQAMRRKGDGFRELEPDF